MARIPVDYSGLKLEFLDQEDLQHIEMKAKGLEFDDCLAYLCIEESDLSEAELNIAKRIWRRGRMGAVNTAAERLFSAMSMRGGGPVAMEYLSKMSGTFQIEATPVGGKTGFTFNVVMPDDA